MNKTYCLYDKIFFNKILIYKMFQLKKSKKEKLLSLWIMPKEKLENEILKKLHSSNHQLIIIPMSVLN